MQKQCCYLVTVKKGYIKPFPASVSAQEQRKHEYYCL